MPKNNSINNASGDFTIDPGASGDSYLQFNINATGEFRIGVDDDDGDAFKISQGSALGTNDTFIMSANGERTMPLQPAFQARVGAANTNITGNGTVATINFTAVDLDQNSDYDGSNTFTAPITGVYKFSYVVFAEQVTSSATYGRTQIVTTGRTYNGHILNIGAYRDLTFNGAGLNMALCAVKMTAGDTAHCTLTVDGMGSDAIDVTNSNTFSLFSGSLDV